MRRDCSIGVSRQGVLDSGESIRFRGLGGFLNRLLPHETKSFSPLAQLNAPGIECSPPTQYRGLAESDWVTVRGKRNRIAIGTPTCFREQPSSCRHARRMTLLCATRVIEHHARHVALWRVRKRAFLPAGKSSGSLAPGSDEARRLDGF